MGPRIETGAQKLHGEVMMEKEILPILKEFISEHFDVPEDDITAESSFVDDLGADSLDMAELSMIVEEKFGIEIQGLDWERLTTVGSSIEYLQERLSSK